MATEYDVFSGLQGAAAGLEVAADTPGASHGDQVSPVVGLGHQFVAGGEIQYQIGPCQTVANPGWLRCPQILADFDGDPGAADIKDLPMVDDRRIRSLYGNVGGG